MCNVNDLTEIPDDLDTPPDSDSEQNQQQLNQLPQLQIRPTPAPNKPVQKKQKVLPPTISMTFVIFHLLLLIFVSDTSWLRLSVLLVKMIVPTGTATATAPPTNSGMRPTVNFTGSSNHRPTSKIFCIFCIFVFLY